MEGLQANRIQSITEFRRVYVAYMYIYQVNGLPEIPMAYIHTPKAFALHQRSSLLDSPDYGGGEGSTSKPLQETLDSLGARCDQVASQLPSKLR